MELLFQKLLYCGARPRDVQQGGAFITRHEHSIIQQTVSPNVLKIEQYRDCDTCLERTQVASLHDLVRSKLCLNSKHGICQCINDSNTVGVPIERLLNSEGPQ